MQKYAEYVELILLLTEKGVNHSDRRGSGEGEGERVFLLFFPFYHREASLIIAWVVWWNSGRKVPGEGDHCGELSPMNHLHSLLWSTACIFNGRWLHFINRPLKIKIILSLLHLGLLK